MKAVSSGYVGHRPFRCIRQVLSFTCGSVSLQMVLHHFRFDVSALLLGCRLFCNPFNGTTLTRMSRVLRTYGFGVCMRSSATVPECRRVLARGGLVLAHVDSDHVGVLYGLAGGAAHFADPSRARGPHSKVPVGRFMNRFDGEALFVTPARLICNCSS